VAQQLAEGIRRTKGRDPNQMTLIEHLAELRSRLIKSLVAFAAAFVVVFALYRPVLHVLQAPLCKVQHPCTLIALSPLDLLGIRIEVSAYGGAVLALPVWAYHLFRFVGPGLKPQEKRYVWPFSLAAVFLFALGGFVAYQSYPHALAFFKALGGSVVTPAYTAKSYFHLLLSLMIAFGVVFEFPVVLVGLELGRVVTPAQLSRLRKYAYVGVLVLAGVITPSSDPYSMFAMAIPLAIFYEVAIVIGKVLNRRGSRAG
jgi:sec-independent protein translocase protein TatC